LLGLENFDEAQFFSIKPVCKISNEIKNFEEIHIGSKHEKLAFEFTLPSDIPSSLIAISSKAKCKASIEYWLIAEYVPFDKANIIDVGLHPCKHTEFSREGHHYHISLSKFRAFRQINIT
jgi:hypothetical protein